MIFEYIYNNLCKKLLIKSHLSKPMMDSFIVDNDAIRDNPDAIRDNPDAIRDNPDAIRDNPDPIRDNPDPIRDNPDAIACTIGIIISPDSSLDSISTIINLEDNKAKIIFKVLIAICIQIIVIAIINSLYYIYKKNIIENLCLYDSCPYYNYDVLILWLFISTLFSIFIMWCFQNEKYLIIPSMILFTFVFSTFIGFSLITYSPYIIFFSLLSSFSSIVFIAFYAYTCSVDNYKFKFIIPLFIGILIGFTIIFIINFIISYNIIKFIYANIISIIYTLYIVIDLNRLYNHKTRNPNNNILIYVTDLYIDIVRISMYLLIFCNADIL